MSRELMAFLGASTFLLLVIIIYKRSKDVKNLNSEPGSHRKEKRGDAGDISTLRLTDK